MSKIQFNEISLSASEFTTLNKEEATEVRGGHNYHYPSLSISFSSYFSTKVAVVEQVNFNENAQFALGGGKFFTSNGNENDSYQINEVTTYQS